MFIFDLISVFFELFVTFISFLPVIAIVLIIGAIVFTIHKKKEQNTQSNTYSSPSHEKPIVMERKNSSPSFVINSTSDQEAGLPEPLFYPDINSFSRFHAYKLKGKNPKTNRQKSETVFAKEGTSPEIAAQKTDLLPPYSLVVDTKFKTEIPASEAQLSYAKNINIPIPHPCSMIDMSLLLSRQLEETMVDYVTPELFLFAGEHGACLSPYCCPENAINEIFIVSDDQTCLEFFAYFTYCLLHGIWHITAPEYSIHNAVFKTFGHNFSSNLELLETIRSLSYENILYMRQHGKANKKNTKNAHAFSIVCGFLDSNLPFEAPSAWEQWKDCHHLPQQIRKQWRSYDKRIIPLSVNQASKTCHFQGVTGHYITTLSSCSCPNFSKNKKPCKHMYRLAYELRKSPDSSQ